MPSGTGLSAPQSLSLSQTRPNLPPLTRIKPLTTDRNQVANSPQAAGTDLITRVVKDVDQIKGVGGNVDFMA